jgi:hypothetical protein
MDSRAALLDISCSTYPATNWPFVAPSLLQMRSTHFRRAYRRCSARVAGRVTRCSTLSAPYIQGWVLQNNEKCQVPEERRQ